MAFEKRSIFTFKTLNAGLLLAVLASIFIAPATAQAMEGETRMPAFTNFSGSVQNGDADALSGVYVPDVLALPVIQQPYGNAGYVSDSDGEVTQFRMASRFGNVGLLAHNNLSGRLFSDLEPGQEVRLIYGDGRVEFFVVSEVLRYQALQPTSPYSSFRSLDGRDETLSAEGMFKRAYFGDRHVTFQTCIERDGELSWGRLFVIAVPRGEAGMSDLKGQGIR